MYEICSKDGKEKPTQSLRSRGLLSAVCSRVQQQKSVLCLKSLKRCPWKRSRPGMRCTLVSCFSGSVPSQALIPGIKFMSQASTQFLNDQVILGSPRGGFVASSEEFSCLFLKPLQAGQSATGLKRTSLRSMAIACLDCFGQSYGTDWDCSFLWAH